MSRLGVIGAIIRKDLVEFSRDRLYVMLSLLSLAAFIAIFWLLPTTVDEAIEVGAHAPGMESVLQGFEEAQGGGLRFLWFGSPEEVRAAVDGGGDGSGGQTVAVGLVFPSDFLETVTTGRPSTVTLLVDGSVPGETRDMLVGFVREISLAVAGSEPPVTLPAQGIIVLGPDRAGDQVPFRERMLPLLVFFTLLVESFALASLVGGEIQQRTVTAVLVTPARTGDVLAAKGATGTILAFSQAVVLLLAMQAFGPNPGAMLLTVLLGSVLSAGVGMIAGSAGRDFMSTLFIGMVFMIALAIPAFGLMFPGAASVWIKVIPSYGIVQAIFSLTSGSAAWGSVAPYLLMALGWCLAFFGVGVAVLKRRVEVL